MSAAGGDATAWAALAPDVPAEWFARPSTLHGARHTQRVHIHAQRLTGELGWADSESQFVLTAALWHDIGRTNDGVEPDHGANGAARAVDLELTGGLAPGDADTVLFAIACHCLSDKFAKEEARRLAEPERALRVLWLLKDADALDRVRLAPWEAADPGQLRHPQTAVLLPFATELYDTLR